MHTLTGIRETHARTHTGTGTPRVCTHRRVQTLQLLEIISQSQRIQILAIQQDLQQLRSLVDKLETETYPLRMADTRYYWDRTKQ